MSADLEEESDLIECWCGAKGAYEELFDHGSLSSCGGSGYLYCHCGGDICVCHHHGETECPGCEECEADFYDFEDGE